MATLKVDLNRQQMRIVDHFAKTMGFSREEALEHWLRNAIIDWYPVIQRDYPVYEVKQEVKPDLKEAGLG